MTTTTLERIVRIRPAYDCVMVQPCVHGSAACATDHGRNHGRHNAEMHLVVRAPDAEVFLGISTGWDLPETPELFRSRTGPRGLFVAYHSRVPRYDGQPMQDTACDIWPGGCYNDVGYSSADEPTAMLVRQGLDPVWEWLEALHDTTFGASKEESTA